jgi:hypothetical protein
MCDVARQPRSTGPRSGLPAGHTWAHYSAADERTRLEHAANDDRLPRPQLPFASMASPRTTRTARHHASLLQSTAGRASIALRLRRDRRRHRRWRQRPGGGGVAWLRLRYRGASRIAKRERPWGQSIVSYPKIGGEFYFPASAPTRDAHSH